MSQRRTLFALCAVALCAVLLLPDVCSAQRFGRGGRFFGGGMGNYGGWGVGNYGWGNYGLGNYGWGNYGLGSYGWGNPYSYGGYYGGMPYYGNWGGNYVMPGYTYGSPQMYSNYSSPIMQTTYYPGTYSNGIAASGQLGYPPGAWMDSVKNQKRALIDMEVPQNAQVTFDGSPTQQQGMERRFITPPLDDPNSHYTYNVTAQWMQNGQAYRQSRTIRLTPGRTTFVNFLKPQINAQGGDNAAVSSSQSAYPPDVRSRGPRDRAIVDVHVPANAQVQFDGNPTVQQGTQRQFMTPPLDPKSRYTYKVTAKWTDQNGQERRESRTVQLTPGQTSDVNFLTPQNDTQNRDGTQQPRQQQDQQPQQQKKTTPPDR